MYTDRPAQKPQDSFSWQFALGQESGFLRILGSKQLAVSRGANCHSVYRTRVRAKGSSSVAGPKPRVLDPAKPAVANRLLWKGMIPTYSDQLLRCGTVLLPEQSGRSHYIMFKEILWSPGMTP